MDISKLVADIEARRIWAKQNRDAYAVSGQELQAQMMAHGMAAYESVLGLIRKHQAAAAAPKIKPSDRLLLELNARITRNLKIRDEAFEQKHMGMFVEFNAEVRALQNFSKYVTAIAAQLDGE